MDSRIGLNDSISADKLNYRIDNLTYSQSMLSCFKRSKAEFVDKYIRNIFWSDDSERDREYEKNMSYGRDFHKMCHRVFTGIPEVDTSSPARSEEMRRIYAIKNQYINLYGESNVEFCPEYSIELYNLRLQVTLDLLVKIYEDGKLSKIFIWDWKVEESIITLEKALKRMQTAVYMYVCKETIGKELNYEDIVMYYYQPKKNKNTKLVYSEKQHKKYEKEIIDTMEEIKNLKTAE